MNVTFTNNFWSRFGETIRKALFFESSYRYDFGLGSKNVRDVCKYYLDGETWRKLNIIVMENKLFNPRDEYNTVVRVMKWLNATYPSSIYYLKDGSRDTWNSPLDTLVSFENRKVYKEQNQRLTITQLKLSLLWNSFSTTDCDDYAILLYNLLRVAGVKKENLYLCFMKTTGEWHLNLMYWHQNTPYAIEGTYRPNDAIKNFGRTPYFTIDYYKYVKWMFNEDKVFRYSEKINQLKR